MSEEFVIYDLPGPLSEDELSSILSDFEDEFEDAKLSFADHSLVEKAASEKDRGGFGFEAATAIGLSLNILMFALEAHDRDWHRRFVQQIQSHLDSEQADEPEYEVIEAAGVSDAPDEWLGVELWQWLPSEAESNLSDAGTQFDCESYAATVCSCFDAVCATIAQCLDEPPENVWPEGVEQLKSELPISLQAGVATNLDFLRTRQQTALTVEEKIEREDAVASLYVTKKTLRDLHRNFRLEVA